MMNLYRYGFLIELERKYQNYFKFANNIYILPPILKKSGLIYYLAFLVIERSRKIKRPIGVILINKVTGVQKVYDMKDYEFCPSKPDFEHCYYNLDDSSIFFPNRNARLEGDINSALLDLANSAENNKYFNIDNNEYQKYKNKIKRFFPPDYFAFFEELEANNITPIDVSIEAKRDISKIKHDYIESKLEQQKQILNVKLKRQFKKDFRVKLSTFIVKKILPLLKGRGGYNKLLFYYKFGNHYINFERDIIVNFNCYGNLFSEQSKQENTKKLLEKEKNELRKMAISCNDKFSTDSNIVENLSKILLIFMNALLVQEIHNSIIPSFDDQIKECITTFEKYKNLNFNKQAKDFLLSVFNELKTDYKTGNNQGLCNVYYGYLAVHYPFEL